MNKYIKTISIVFLLAVLPLCLTAKKKHYQVVDSIVIKKMENNTKKFDIENYNYSKKSEEYAFIKEDGTEIEQYLSGYGYYVERETPPLPKLYTIYREFYLNGNLKKEGINLRRIHISIWREYDEQGNLTKETNWDETYGKFDYNQVVLFLAKQGHINIKTGKGRDEFTIGINKEKHCWDVNVWPQESNNYKGFSYLLDLDTGKVKKKGKILPSGS